MTSFANILRREGEVNGTFLALLVVSVLASCCASSTPGNREGPGARERSPVELTAEVDRAEAGISEPILFRVTLDADPDLSADLPEAGSSIKGFRIVDFGTEGPKQREGRRWTQQWFKLQADLVGSYLLPSLKTSYKDQDGEERFVETPPIYVEIKSSLDPESGEKDIRDIKEPEKIKREIPLSWMLLASGGVLLAGCAVGLLVWRQRRRKEKWVSLPPEELALQELQDLESTGILDEERYREYVFNLSVIFRRYLERRAGIPAVEQTTEEILGSLRSRNRLQEPLKKEVRSFLEETDPIKYRGLAPETQETEAIRVRLLSFLERAAQRTEETDVQSPGG